MAELLDEVGQLIANIKHRLAERPLGGRGLEADLQVVRTRLDEPLRVAIAGRVKAGKSTLLNALVGEQLAPTDAGECTRIVTWYQHGPTYRVTLVLKDGSSRTASFTRQSGAIEIDLAELSSDRINRIVVEWPSKRLADITLIDTPGVSSLNADVSARTMSFLTPDDGPAEADAVLYLMRHMHADDLSFLESFHDDELTHASPINAIGLLSRADEIGVGRPNAMRAAERIAERYRSDPKLRRLCQTVRPMCGLLAETATTLTEDEYRALEQLAAMDRKQVDALMLSADRFAGEHSNCELTPMTRRHLLDRFGLFGIRTALPLIRQGRATSAGQLAGVLEARSGIIELRDDLLDRFAARRDVLRARSALASIDRLLATEPQLDHEFMPEVERIRSGAHAMAELRLLNDFRRGLLDFDNNGAEVERLLGVAGTSTTDRLGLKSDTNTDVVRDELLAAIDRWRRRGEHPLATRDVANAATVLVRTCEGELAGLQ